MAAAVGVTVVLGLTTMPQPSADAAARPDLKVVRLSSSATSVTAGKTFTVSDRTQNAGTARAGTSYTGYVLSTDKVRSRTDVVLGSRKVGRLRPGAAVTGSKTVTVPAGTRARRYYLIACADVRKQVTESRETNNCRVAASMVTVRRPSSTTPTGPGLWPKPANPLNVTYSVDADNAATGTAIPGVPTTIATTGADGSEYTLDIPEQAVLSNVDITLTPITAVNGMPLTGGLQAAVEITPHNLRLYEPATLTIVSPNPAPVADQTPFLFYEDGEDFHAYPAATPNADEVAEGTGATLRLRLWHFSSVGVGAGTDADRAAAAARTPARTEAQYQQATADLVNDLRQALLQGDQAPPNVRAAFQELAVGYFEDIVRPKLEAAKTDASMASEAIAYGLGWERQMQLVGAEDEARWNYIQEAILVIIRNAIDVSYDECVNGHRLDRILWFLAMERTSQLLGMEADFPDILPKMFSCYRFEVSYGARFTATDYDAGDGWSYEQDAVWDVAAAPFVVKLADGPDDNHGDLVWRDFSYAETWTTTCDESTAVTTQQGTGTTAGRTGAILDLDVNLYDGKPPDQTGKVAAGRLWITPGANGTGGLSEPSEQYTETYTGCGASEPNTSEHTRWMEAFATSPPGEDILTNGVPIYLEGQDGAILLDKSFVGDNSLGGLGDAALETWNIYVTLVHAPSTL